MRRLPGGRHTQMRAKATQRCTTRRFSGTTLPATYVICTHAEALGRRGLFFFPGTVPRAPQILRRQIEKNAGLMYIFSGGRCTKNYPLFRSPSASSLPRHAHSAQSFATPTSPCVVRSTQGAKTFEEILLYAASLSSCPTYCRRSSWLLQAWPSLAVRIESGTAARAGQAGMAGRPCLCVEISSEQAL